jgi:hypothetical protein
MRATRTGKRKGYNVEVGVGLEEKGEGLGGEEGGGGEGGASEGWDAEEDQ